MKILWVPAHAWLRGNESVVELAQTGADVGPLTCGLSYRLYDYIITPLIMPAQDHTLYFPVNTNTGMKFI